MGVKIVSNFGSPYARVNKVVMHMGGFLVVRDASDEPGSGLLVQVVARPRPGAVPKVGRAACWWVGGELVTPPWVGNPGL